MDFLIDILVEILENTWMLFKLFLSIVILFGLLTIPVHLIIVLDAFWPALLFIPAFGIGLTIHDRICD